MSLREIAATRLYTNGASARIGANRPSFSAELAVGHETQ
jgi:hypothetical protein